MIRGLIWAIDRVVRLIQFCMAAQAILSWNPRFRYSSIMQFLNNLTEPFVYPVRQLMYRMGFQQTFGLDIPFLVTFLLLGMVPNIAARILMLFA